MKNDMVSIKWTLRTLAITALCFSLAVITPNGLIVSLTVQAQSPKAQTISQRLETARARVATHQADASKYDIAIRNISTLENAPLKTEADVRRAIDILQKNEINNDLVFGKGVTIALKVNSFKAGVRAEANRVSANGVVRQLKSKSLSVSRVGGFNELKTTLKAQFDRDRAMLQRVGQRLQQASKQRGLSFSLPKPSTEGDVAAYHERQRANLFMSTIGYGSKLVATPISWSDVERTETSQIDPITGSILAGIAMGALAFIIVEYAKEKSEDIEEDPDTGKSQLGSCLDEVKADRDSCLRENRGNFFGEAGCWGKWLVDEAACLLLPN